MKPCSSSICRQEGRGLVGSLPSPLSHAWRAQGVKQKFRSRKRSASLHCRRRSATCCRSATARSLPLPKPLLHPHNVLSLPDRTTSACQTRCSASRTRWAACQRWERDTTNKPVPATATAASWRWPPLSNCNLVHSTARHSTLPNHALEPHTLMKVVEAVEAARASGVDVVWVIRHHDPAGGCSGTAALLGRRGCLESAGTCFILHGCKTNLQLQQR